MCKQGGYIGFNGMKPLPMHGLETKGLEKPIATRTVHKTAIVIAEDPRSSSNDRQKHFSPVIPRTSRLVGFKNEGN